MRAEADEAKVETEWLNLKRPNLGEDGGEFTLAFLFTILVPLLFLALISSRLPITPTDAFVVW